MKTDQDTRKEVEDFWNDKPCGSDRSIESFGTKEYFLEIESDRYKYEGHINNVLSKIDWSGKEVLEIGTGVGTDARSIIARGAVYTGINIDQGSVDVTSRALEVFSLQGEVARCDATNLVYEDDSFDVVYSFGAFPCIPDLDLAVSEIYRVLKPGGEVLALLYNRSSINYYVEIMFLRKLFRHFLVIPGAIRFFEVLGFPRDRLEGHLKLYQSSRNMSKEEWISRNTDGPDNPYICVQGAKEGSELFRKFDMIRQEVYFFDYRHWGVIGRLMPKVIVNFLGRKWGWHRIIHCTKRES